MGRYVLDHRGWYWYVEDPEDEIRIESYVRNPDREPDDFSWWKDPDPLRHLPPPVIRELTEDEYQAILSVLTGETKEEWVARRTAEGKPISPVGEEKQE